MSLNLAAGDCNKSRKICTSSCSSFASVGVCKGAACLKVDNFIFWKLPMMTSESWKWPMVPHRQFYLHLPECSNFRPLPTIGVISGKLRFRLRYLTSQSCNLKHATSTQNQIVTIYQNEFHYRPASERVTTI